MPTPQHMTQYYSADWLLLQVLQSMYGQSGPKAALNTTRTKHMPCGATHAAPMLIRQEILLLGIKSSHELSRLRQTARRNAAST